MQEMILLVGYSGCGKSPFYHRHLRPYGYRHISRNTMLTRERCLKEASEYWARGHSVAVDKNPTVADQQAFIDIVRRVSSAKRKRGTTASDGGGGGATPSPMLARIFMLMHSRRLANHMNYVRVQVKGAPHVPSIAYNVFQSPLE
nr:unnamed protein product [Leishmania braziliensis]